MYKLENNVEWTDGLKNAFKHNVTRAKILYTGAEINEQNNLKDLTLTEQRYISNLGFIGTATARMLELNLVDIQNGINLENKELTLKIGADYEGDTYYINYGNFIVDKPPENDATNGNIRVVAYDYMIKFNKPYVDRVTYPCTLLTVLQDICSQAGVELGSQDFANKSFMVQDNQFEGATLREVLQNIAKCAFSWARIGQDNKLYLDFSLTADGTETITIDEYKTNSFKKANEYYGPINQVTYADSTFEGQESRVKDQQSIDTNGLKELVIYDNMFAYTPESRDELIQAGSGILGLIYMPITQLDLIGFAYLDSRDIIEIRTLDQSTYYSRVFNHSIKYNGTLSDSVVTKGTSNNEEAYKNTAADNFQNQQTRFILDKANKKIQMIIEKLVDINEITVGAGSSTGEVSFTAINQSEPIYVQIKPLGENITYLYPRNNLFPANNLYITLRRLRFTNTSTNEFFDYDLPDDLLYYNSENFDEFVLDYNSHKVTINKKCEYDANGNVVLLSQPRTDEYEFPENEAAVNLTDGDYTVDVLKYDNTPYICYLYCRLMVQNIYTKQFTTKIETETKIEQSEQSIILSVDQKLKRYPTTEKMNSAITVTADGIMTTVENNNTKANIIAKINDNTSLAKIEADNVDINGTVSANGNFKIKPDGTMECVNAKVNGEIIATSGTFTGDIYMATNKKIASTSQGIMSTLFATGTGPINGYEYLGYTADGTKLFRSSPMVGIYVPNNFTPVYAYLFIEQISPHFVVEAGSTDGRASAIKIKKGSSGPSLTLPGFASEVFMNQSALSGIDITQTAFGSATKIPDVGTTVSNNIASQLSKGQLNVISAYITDTTYENTQITWQGTEQLNAGRITGLAKLSIQVIGYLNPF